MKVNLDQELVDFEGAPIHVTRKIVFQNGSVADVDVMKTVEKDGKKEEVPVVWTLGRLCSSVTAQSLEEDKNIEPDKTVERWKLAQRLHAGGEQEISVEEAGLLRKRAPKLYSIVLAGQACEMLKG